MNKRVFVVGIGHRARQGKDTVANFIKELRPNVHILHFADALYEEVSNGMRKYYLISRNYLGRSMIPHKEGNASWIYALLNDSSTGKYFLCDDVDVPYLHQLMIERDIAVYWGMDEKDAPMLQFWGTNFRRKQNPDYWICQVQRKIQSLLHQDRNKNDLWIIISDTRFKNEVNFIKDCGGYYIRVIRTDESGNQYIDALRDPNHPSEIDIVNEIPLETLVAKSGDLDTLKHKTEELLERLERKYYVSK
jgi:hypothetical protein